MTLSILFWILMLLWLIFWGLERWGPPNAPYWGYGGWVLQFVLFLIIGWQVFGAPIK